MRLSRLSGGKGLSRSSRVLNPCVLRRVFSSENPLSGKNLYLPYQTVMRLKHYCVYDVEIMIWLVLTVFENKTQYIPRASSGCQQWVQAGSVQEEFAETQFPDGCLGGGCKMRG
jgi:hypothetical protein